MQSVFNVVRTVCKVIFTIPYVVLTLYTIIFCSYHGIRPIYDFFHTDFFRSGAGYTFREMISVNDASVFLYLLIFLVGIISLIALMIMNRREKKIFTALILSIIPLTITWITLPVNYLDDMKYLYWLFIAWCVATLLFLIREAIHNQRQKKNQPNEENT